MNRTGKASAIVIDLKRDEQSGVILNQLYKHTQMENTFGIIMLAIENGQPRVFNLKDILQSFVDFRKQVVIRRTKFDLARAKERAHILEGLIIALQQIDEVIAVIKAVEKPPGGRRGPLCKLSVSRRFRPKPFSRCDCSA